MDLKIMTDSLVKSFTYGFLLSGISLVSFFLGHLSRNAMSTFNKIVK